MLELTPRQIVDELDKYIVGQKEAKRSIAIAIRNRWRRQNVAGEMHDEIGPKNMMMIGPTGVGKTELARRLATLTGAPFIKVDATKYTEVGYYGRDVESMARDLVENAIGIVRSEEREKNAEKSAAAAEKHIVDLLVEKFEKEKRDLSEFEENESEDAEVVSEAPQNAEIVAENDSDLDLEKKQDETSDSKQPDAAQSDVKQSDAEKDEDSEDVKKDEPLDPFKGIDFSKPPTPASLTEMLGALTSIIFSDSGNKEGEKDKSDGEKKEVKEKSTSKKEPKISKRMRRAKIETLLALGKLEDELITVVEERRMAPVVMGGVGLESMTDDLQNMLENLTPKRNSRRELPVSEARKIFVEQEVERTLDKDKISERAISLAENLGIIFIDEIDKIVGNSEGRGADVSRQGVQRDLLPIVEGTTIQTKYGLFSTEHVLFIAAGAFHRSKPSDLTPELQGRFPIRVELSELKKDDFVRILTEPKSALTKQYAALMQTENVELVFKDDAIETIAQYAADANVTTQNIGARRLCTIMELLLEDLNFEAPEMETKRVEIDAEYVRSKIEAIVRDEDLSKFVL